MSSAGSLRAYVDGGGSLLATFETSMYNERNERRADFGLADVFGIHKAGEVQGTNGNAFYARIERQHEILNGFTSTNWIPGAENRVPVAPVDEPGPDRGARLRGLPAGAVVPAGAAHRRTGGGGAGERAEAGWSTFPATSSAPCGGRATPTWRGCCRMRIRWVQSRHRR